MQQLNGEYDSSANNTITHEKVFCIYDISSNTLRHAVLPGSSDIYERHNMHDDRVSSSNFSIFHLRLQKSLVSLKSTLVSILTIRLRIFRLNGIRVVEQTPKQNPIFIDSFYRGTSFVFHFIVSRTRFDIIVNFLSY